MQQAPMSPPTLPPTHTFISPTQFKFAQSTLRTLHKNKMLGHSTRPLNDLMPHHATPGQSGLERGQGTKVAVTQTRAPVLPDLQQRWGWNVVPWGVQFCASLEADNRGLIGSGISQYAPHGSLDVLTCSYRMLFRG